MVYLLLFAASSAVALIQLGYELAEKDLAVPGAAEE